jgi:hypothetical protein
MSVYAFVREARGPFMAELLSAEAPLAEISRFEDDLRAAIEMACASGEPWVRNDPPQWDPSQWPAFFRDNLFLDLDPRAAARWLLSNPMYKHLIHPDWARVVLRDANIQPDVTVTAAPTVKPKRRRGPKPNERNRVLLAMRSMPISVLLATPEKEMAGTFGASRYVCREARNIVESESRLV